MFSIIYCVYIQGYFPPLLFLPFYTCKLHIFPSVLNLPGSNCVFVQEYFFFNSPMQSYICLVPWRGQKWKNKMGANSALYTETPRFIDYLQIKYKVSQTTKLI